MKTLVALVAVALAALSIDAQEWIGGAEGGEGFGSAYLQRRVTRKLASGNELVLWAGASYLYYDLDEGPERSVRSPGVNGGGMYRWILPNAQIGLGGGYDVRWTEREFSDGTAVQDTEHGPLAMGEGAIRFSERVFSSASVSYSDSNEWLASRANVMFEVGSGFRIGPEVGWHGNDDLEVEELGGILEFAMDEQWLWIRAGQARERERSGIEQTRPYFSVGVTRSF
jgi:hypothetical protein